MPGSCYRIEPSLMKRSLLQVAGILVQCEGGEMLSFLEDSGVSWKASLERMAFSKYPTLWFSAWLPLQLLTAAKGQEASFWTISGFYRWLAIRNRTLLNILKTSGLGPLDRCSCDSFPPSGMQGANFHTWGLTNSKNSTILCCSWESSTKPLKIVNNNFSSFFSIF